MCLGAGHQSIGRQADGYLDLAAEQAEVHRYGELLHLLHALRYLTDGSAAPLEYHLIARFRDLTRRDS